MFCHFVRALAIGVEVSFSSLREGLFEGLSFSFGEEFDSAASPVIIAECKKMLKMYKGRVH